MCFSIFCKTDAADITFKEELQEEPVTSSNHQKKGEGESFLEEIQKDPSSAKQSTSEAAEDEDEDDDLDSIFSHDSDDDPTWAPSTRDEKDKIGEDTKENSDKNSTTPAAAASSKNKTAPKLTKEEGKTKKKRGRPPKKQAAECSSGAETARYFTKCSSFSVLLGY